MSQRAFGVSLGAISRKWCVFAERRRDYYFELQASGRWRRYYSETAFAAQLAEVIRDVEIWERLAGPPAAAADLLSLQAAPFQAPLLQAAE